MLTSYEKQAYTFALSWYNDQGITDVWADKPIDRTKTSEGALSKSLNHTKPSLEPAAPPIAAIIGSAQARQEAIKTVQRVKTLDQLRSAIGGFEGLSIRKTALNMVFSDGNPQAEIMLVGEAPGADEDRQGKPFVGVSGQLLDKMLKCIGLDRKSDNPKDGIYISNILNWRPPGNRTPTQAEIEISLPFIEKHIQLIQPKLLILCGSISAQALLGRTDSVSKLRKTEHLYQIRSQELGLLQDPIHTFVTYHPAYLLRSPSQKKAAWSDLLGISCKIKGLQ